VRRAKLPLAILLLAALARQLRELDVDQRLEGLRLRLARQLERARERSLDLRLRGRSARAKQDPRQRQDLIGRVPARRGDLEPLRD